MIGQHISHFQILEKLGEGGMGVVYKGRDTRLERLVAIKVLSAAAVSNPERRLRFVQEAQAASALNHPNIVTVHDIDRQGEMAFIAMEYVDGRTLEELIGRRGLRLGEALKYAVQIADALAAAHAAGIVHRDIKPGNVMVTAKGLVKVLDFGLAKLTETSSGEDEATRTIRPQTEEGTVLGTVAYMSPEQVQSRKVDPRSDIFSFGLVLYEMLTGRRAFSGDSKMSTMAAILNKEPKPATEIVEGLPREVDRVISLCLRKDPARRFQHMEDVKVSLEALKEESETPGAGVQAAPRATRRWWPLAAALALLAAAVGWYFLRPGAQPAAPLKVVPLTSYAGSENNPSFSPDGTQVAFSWNGDKQDNFDIYVRLVAGGTPLRLTTNPAPDVAPSWSPDGTQIAFVRAGQGVFLISPLGGAERRLTGDAASRVAWTPDGKALVVSLRSSAKEPYRLVRISVATGEKGPLTAPPEQTFGDINPALSPDGKSLAFVRWLTENGASDLYVAAVAGGELHRLTHDGLWVYEPVWTPDGREVVCASNRTGGVNLWRIPVAGGGPPRRLDFVPGEARGPAISAPGPGKPVRLAYSRTVLDDNLWRLEVGSGKPATQVVSSTLRDWCGRFSPDGQRIAFASDRSGSFEIWVCAADGSNPVQLTSFGTGVPDAPRWSPDGQRIAFAALVASNNRDIYVIGADGGAPRRLTTEPSEEGRPSWSQDGRWIYFRSDRSGSQQIWKMPAEGGPAVQVTRAGGFEVFESPDGKLLYYTKGRRTLGLWSMPVGGGEETRVLDKVLSNYWSVCEQGVYFVGFGPALDAGPKTVNLFRFGTGRTTQVATIEARITGVGPVLSATRDGRWLLWTQNDHTGSDLMLVENFR
jgi:Tol biopolymer transport system component/predicted Ser/Thr protein kinase